MISSISEEFFENMDNKPDIKSLDEFELHVTGANGLTSPYSGYIEAKVKLPNSNMVLLTVPLLVIKHTEYNKEVPAIVGMIIIRE
ncbi:hypothetical protein DPMN_081202 [Dreissena polymorpha]|uniref:Uncharacterized protein n=1 Tax=Dreissena polymorpha TaxID=45954 RepID=A0A9D3Y5Y2_DREPO|nr:hypothetical protein DPMN_081202 [Dreissena polymorpha]